jgi:formamidopyrimidine-DNA glycosylase
MPELPEVETIRRIFEPQIKGYVITSVTVNRPEIVEHPTADDFCRLLVGQTVSVMTRRGKFLGIELTSGDCVILHLRMTGCLLVTPSDYPQEKHTHVVFHLKNGMELRFSDTRRFGRFWLLRKGKTDTYSGIGNIYSDEILFTAKIHPSCPANSLNAEEWECLASAIPERLSYFIEKNSLTPEEYLEGKGQNYRNTLFLQVYGHAGEPCPHCGNLLQRTVIGGRSSVYCPECQAADM